MYYDFFVHMKDGRCFGFSAVTPEYVREYMLNEGISSFVEAGMVIINEPTITATLDALERCLTKAELYGIEHFGFPCNVRARTTK